MSDQEPDAMQRARLANGGRGEVNAAPGKFQQAAQEALKPTYRKKLMDNGQATPSFMIVVYEGWRSWILCTDMYEWAADRLILILEEVEVSWPQ